MADQVYTNTAEGASDGTAVVQGSGGNTGGAGSTAFPIVVGTWAFEADAAKSGTCGYKNTLGASPGYLRGDDPTISAGERGGAGQWFYFPGGTLLASLSVLALRTAADAQLGSLSVFSSDNKLYFYNRAGTRVPTGYATAPSALTPGWYRDMLMETPGASTTTARIEAKAWDASSALIMAYDSGATYDAGTTDPVGRTRFGGATTATGLTEFWTDNLRWGHKAAGDIGDVPNIPPTATITANQTVAPSAPVTVSVSATDVDGTIASYAWSGVRYTTTAAPAAITFTGGITNTASASYTASSATTGVLDVLTCIITDNSGDSVTKTTEVRVPTAGAAKPLSGYDALAPGWTLIGGGASVGASLNDGSSTTRIESPDLSATAALQPVRLAPMTTRASYRQTITDAVLTAATTNSSKVRFSYGGTQVTERATSTLKKTSDNSTSDVTTTDLTLYFDLTAGEVAAMLDWGFPQVTVVAAS